MVTLFLDPRNTTVVPVTRIVLKHVRLLLYLPVKMEVVRLKSLFLLKTGYQLDRFEMEIPNSLETRYLTQHKKSLYYQLFQEELKIREMSFEYLLL